MDLRLFDGDAIWVEVIQAYVENESAYITLKSYFSGHLVFEDQYLQ